MSLDTLSRITPPEPSEAHKAAEIEAKKGWPGWEDPIYRKAPFDPRWPIYHWSRWATIAEAFRRLGVEPGSRVLDVGCGIWTSAFLAEAQYLPLGIDISPAMIAISEERAARWGVPARFKLADMDNLDLGEQFDAALVFDALHHSTRQADVVRGIARHLRPGGWVLFGEPTWLHAISPDARRVSRETGWVERGVTLRSLRRDCRRAGLGNFRRFFEPTRPYESRLREFAWNLARLVGANFLVAPQFLRWLAAQKPAQN